MISKKLLLCFSTLVQTMVFAQAPLQTSSKVVVDDGYDYTELSVTPWGGSHGIFFGAKMNYTGSNHLWGSGNTVYAQPSGPYNYGAFSMGYIANGGVFSFYDGGQSTGAGNPVTWTSIMTLKRGGNVGIGTESPAYKFEVCCGVTNLKSGSNEMPSPGTIGNGTSLFVSNSDNLYGLLGGVHGSGNGWLQVQRVDGQAITYNLSLQPIGGNVGIGTATPQSKLAVNGDISAKKVKVTQTGWADYVFEPTYQLPTLAEVEAFIKQYKHLPGVPSAKEVEREGLDLGENQATLLKKIEELTLYVIDLKKQVDAQNATIQMQQEKLNEFQKRMQ